MTDPRRIFTFLLPKREVCEEKTLYYRDGGNALLSDGFLKVPAGETVSFDCYFNLFDCAIYSQNTPIEEVTYRLTLQGEVTVKLSLLRSGKKEDRYEVLPLLEQAFSLKEKTEVSLPLPLSVIENKGSVFLSLQAESDCFFYDGYIQSDRDPLNDIKIGIAITTFKRESFVKRNVAQLVRDLPKDRFSVFVVDNGNTLMPQDVAGACLFPNKNLGGSGGFTRGIMEIQKSEDCTHILLTDDDIAFESEIFLRTAAILSYASDAERVMIGASMLLSDRPYLQNELGAIWNGIKQTPNNAHLDLRDPFFLAENADCPAADYSGWWFNCFPISLPKRGGLPFPFFIKIDDAEYCIRSDCKILLLNGIGVWHEGFDRKFSPALEYYHLRNGLILNALHYPKRGGLYHFGNLLRGVAKQLILQRYRTMELIFRAFDDFLAGAESFAQTDGERLHRDLSSLGEKQVSRAELEAQGYDLSSPQKSFLKTRKGLPFKKKLTLNGYLLPATKEPYRVIDLTDFELSFFYRARRVVQYNPITEKGFVTEQKRGVLFRTGFRLIKYFFKLLFGYRKAARSFRSDFSDLISEESWKKRLDLPLDR